MYHLDPRIIAPGAGIAEQVCRPRRDTIGLAGRSAARGFRAPMTMIHLDANHIKCDGGHLSRGPYTSAMLIRAR